MVTSAGSLGPPSWSSRNCRRAQQKREKTGHTDMIYLVDVLCPLVNNSGVHVHVRNLVETQGRLGSTFYKQILKVAVETLDPAVVFAKG